MEEAAEAIVARWPKEYKVCWRMCVKNYSNADEMLKIIRLMCRMSQVAEMLHLCQETWYVPPSKVNKIAGGKLVEKLRNTWRQIKSSMTPESSQSKETSASIDDDGQLQLLLYC